MISIDANSWSISRVIWLYVSGEWPVGRVIRLNGNRFDDRIENLADLGTTKEDGTLTQRRLKTAIFYDPETGDFRWKQRPTLIAGRVLTGDLVGSWNDQGYRKICIGGRTYRAHRLAWLYMTGEWPTALVDHINGNRGDNRFANLRLATPGENVRNGHGWARRKAPYKGISYDKRTGRWSAFISLGGFETPEEAHAAYVRWSREIFGDFANPGANSPFAHTSPARNSTRQTM